MSSRPEIPAQTALRGIAALTVFIAHAEFFHLFPQAPSLQTMYGVFLWQNPAVDLFFELSGFILCYVYLLQPFTWQKYALARFARIYPVYLAALLSFLLMNVLAWMKTGIFSSGTTWTSVLSNLLLVQCWPGLPHVRSINQPTWSISVEVFLYIFLFPALCFIQKYMTQGVKLVFAIVPALILAGIYILGYQWDNVVASPLSPVRGILCFTSGFFVCTLGLEQGFTGVSKKIELIVLLLLFSCLLFRFPLGHAYAVLGFPFLVYFTADTSSFSARLFAFPLLIWLGDLSYSIYVWHLPLIQVVSLLTGMRQAGQGHEFLTHPSLLHALLYMTVLVVVILTISHLSHYYFEKPVARWLRGKSA